MKEGKTEIPGLYKVSNGILINKDETALFRYKKEKSNLKKIKSIENDLSLLKTDISEIKELLKGLVR